MAKSKPKPFKYQTVLKGGAELKFNFSKTPATGSLAVEGTLNGIPFNGIIFSGRKRGAWKAHLFQLTAADSWELGASKAGDHIREAVLEAWANPRRALKSHVKRAAVPRKAKRAGRPLAKASKR